MAKSNNAFATAITELGRCYGVRRRATDEDALDGVVLGLLTMGVGEGPAIKLVKKLHNSFVDWNEIRVASARDMMGMAKGLPEDVARKIKVFLNSLFEESGTMSGESVTLKKPQELRAWLGKIDILDAEDIETIVLFALGGNVMPAGDGLVTVCRRLGLVARKATRVTVRKAVLKGLPPEQYREFAGLLCEHAASVCHPRVPECAQCKIKRICKSKGKW
jgi:endonuclease III